MSDRLSDLRRQRALAQEQLAWLDREIAREVASAAPPPVAAVSPAVPAPTFTTPLPAATAAAIPSADAIIEEYRVPPESLHRDVKKGCLLYFALAFLLVGLAIVLVYFLLGSR